jgi:DNA polymerase alpha subunit A
VNIDDPTPPDKLPCTVQTFVRPLDQFPPNFEARAKANGKGTISPAKNERMLLNTLLSEIISLFCFFGIKLINFFFY